MTQGYAPDDLPPWLTVTAATRDAIRDDAAASTRLPGSATRTRAGLRAALIEALDLPAYVGHTWDALSDAVRDRLAAGPLTLLIEDAGQLLADEPPEQLGLLLRVLGDAAADAPHPLRVALVDAPGRLAALRRRVVTAC